MQPTWCEDATCEWTYRHQHCPCGCTRVTGQRAKLLRCGNCGAEGFCVIRNTRLALWLCQPCGQKAYQRFLAAQNDRSAQLADLYAHEKGARHQR